MVERILAMLSQFLISNQSLEINNSFRIYIKILSVDHMQIKTKETRLHKKRTKAFFQLKNRRNLVQNQMKESLIFDGLSIFQIVLMVKYQTIFLKISVY